MCGLQGGAVVGLWTLLSLLSWMGGCSCCTPFHDGVAGCGGCGPRETVGASERGTRQHFMVEATKTLLLPQQKNNSRIVFFFF
uniref:Putative secreted protein n=1 Tax=Ixodes ricinus TaxID=34613 RepID=A0A6B0U7A2_IXORI